MGRRTGNSNKGMWGGVFKVVGTGILSLRWTPGNVVPPFRRDGSVDYGGRTLQNHHSRSPLAQKRSTTVILDERSTSFSLARPST